MVTEGDEVQVVGENLLLAQCLVDLRSHAHLAQLAGDGLLGGGLLILFVLGGDEQQVILHVLLIERRRALGHAAGEDVGGYRTEVALDVHAFVVVEAAVLDGDDGVLHRLRDLVRSDGVATLRKQVRHVLAGRVLDSGHAGHVGGLEVVDVRLHRLLRARDGDAAHTGDGCHGERAEKSYEGGRADHLQQGLNISHLPYTTLLSCEAKRVSPP